MREWLYQSRVADRSLCKLRKKCIAGRVSARRSLFYCSPYSRNKFLFRSFARVTVSTVEILFLFARQESGVRDSHKIHCICADAMIRETGSAFWRVHSDSENQPFVATLVAEVWKKIQKRMIEKNEKKKKETEGKRETGRVGSAGFAGRCGHARLGMMIVFDWCNI